MAFVADPEDNLVELASGTTGRRRGTPGARAGRAVSGDFSDGAQGEGHGGELLLGYWSAKLDNHSGLGPGRREADHHDAAVVGPGARPRVDIALQIAAVRPGRRLQVGVAAQAERQRVELVPERRQFAGRIREL